MIKQADTKIVREQFGVEFHYSDYPILKGIKIEKAGYIKVYRINSNDLLQTIKFFGNDRLKTKQEFADVCTQWCDQNAA